MELTRSWSTSLPAPVAERFELRETRNAAAVLAATCPVEFEDMCTVLGGFALRTADLIDPGGNESRLAARLNTAFRSRGWREGRVDTVVTSRLQVQGWAPAGEHGVTVRESEVVNEGYKVDNVKGRVALDVEWNAKDGNLDRDVGAYRALYDAGLIDGAVVLTRTHDDLRELARDLARAAGRSDEQVRSRLSTSTTTHLGKLESRMSRGDAGGCPLLAVAISRRCWRAADDESDPRPEAAEPPLMLIEGTTP